MNRGCNAPASDEGRGGNLLKLAVTDGGWMGDGAAFRPLGKEPGRRPSCLPAQQPSVMQCPG